MTRSDELTDKLLDGALTDAEWAELESLLATDPFAHAGHMALLELEGVLRGLRTEFDLSDATLAKVKEAQAEKTARAVLSEIASQPAPAWATRHTPSTPQRRRRWAVACGLVAIAAALLLGVWLGSQPAETAKPDPAREFAANEPGTARLTSSTGSVELLTPQGDVLPAAEGGDVPAGHTLRTIGEESQASVEMPDHTTVEIAPDSVVRFIALGGRSTTVKPRLFLASGQLTAAVPETSSDRQLVVGTGVAEVFAGKGTFVVSSAGPESARVDVKKGNVDVVRRDERTRVPVSSGAAIVQASFEKILIEPSARIDRTPARSLTFPNPREAVFSRDGSEVWVASPRQLTRWTRDGGTADAVFQSRKGLNFGPVVLVTRDKGVLVTSVVTTPMTAKDEKDEKVVLRTVPGGEEIGELALKLSEARLWTVAPNATWFATAEAKPNQKRLRVFDGVTGEERFTREFEELVSAVAASPDGKLLAAALTDQGRGLARVVLLDPMTGDRINSLPTQKKGCTALTFSADGDHLAAGFNGLIQVWNVRTRELVRTVTGFERVVTCLAFSPDGSALAGGTPDGQVWVWSAATGRPVQRIDVGARNVRCLAFSPDGRRLVTVAPLAGVMIWDIREAVGEVQ
jgi:ferric-dicitrate binding protein FerR (iron transport regulator)